MIALRTVRIDVSLTDEAILREILNRLGDSYSKAMSYEELAKAVGCHPNTVLNATRRLASAGRIRHTGGRGKPTEFARND